MAAAIAVGFAASPAPDAPARLPPLAVIPDAAGAVRPSPSPQGRPNAQRLDPQGTAGDPGVIRPVSPSVLTGYHWPLPRGRLTNPFGPSPWGSRVVDGRLFHDGIDLATFCGDKVVAAHSGVVLAAGRRYDRYMGWLGDLQPYFDRLDEKGAWTTLPIVVITDDGNGYRSVYAHLSVTYVEPGDVVRAGQGIGKEGATGRAFGCHLHYELFSPLESATMGLDADVAKRMKLPLEHIARVDPLLVMPPRPDPTKPQPTATPAPTPPLPAPFVPVAP
jgi:murein DD-endopeptidase MepM/ murein hydrolase activator NlpD